MTSEFPSAASSPQSPSGSGKRLQEYEKSCSLSLSLIHILSCFGQFWGSGLSGRLVSPGHRDVQLPAEHSFRQDYGRTEKANRFRMLLLFWRNLNETAWKMHQRHYGSRKRDAGREWIFDANQLDQFRRVVVVVFLDKLFAWCPGKDGTTASPPKTPCSIPSIRRLQRQLLAVLFLELQHVSTHKLSRSKQPTGSRHFVT